MVAVDLKSLIGRLDDLCRRSLEAAAGLTLSRSNFNVEIEHWLLQLLEAPDSDLLAILRQYEVEPSRLAADLTRVLDRLKTGNTRAPALSPHFVQLAREAWMLASLDYGAARVRSGHLLCALLSEESLAGLAREASAQLARIVPEAPRRELPRITANTAEAAGAEVAAEGAPGGDGAAATPRSGSAALDQFTIDLTRRAKEGKIDPVLGRDAEIRQVIDILTRRRQNNPILTGEAGVGKTAVVEGFALRIAAGDVPPALKNVALRTLDLGLLQAGAGMKGEFENRLKSVINEVKASPQPIILFIDEAHTMIGAGGQAGQGDAANLLKPALARGELRTIAATTWSEYKKYFEKDPALTRRFQVVKVEEPAEAQAVAMIRGLVGTLEQHHNVRVLDEAVDAAVRLSHRYISGRQLPDKAVSVLDTACARVALGQVATPPAVEDCQRRIANIETETRILEREAITGSDSQERRAELAKELTETQARLTELEARWGQERRLIDELRGIRGKLEAHAAATRPGADAAAAEARLTDDDVVKLQADLARLNEELTKIQGETPLMQV